MGRSNRSRKRRDEMNKIKKDRYDAKELIRLKKTLGLLDADGKEIKMEIGEVADIKTSKEIKRVSVEVVEQHLSTYPLKSQHIGSQIQRAAGADLRASGEPGEGQTDSTGQREDGRGARLQQQNPQGSVRQLSRVVQKEEDRQTSTQEAARAKEELQAGLDHGQRAALEERQRPAATPTPSC